jgi:5-methyltetrahydrofolate--homocysteine methyltransferase
MIDSQITQKLADIEEQETLNLVRKELEAGTDPIEILEACREGVVLVGKRYEKGEYFLPELIMAGEIFNELSEILRPALGGRSAKTKGTVVFGTVRGDVHDIGKEMVIAILRGVGYEVHDLGVNVAPEQFVTKLQETGAAILGLSGLITTSYDSMKETVEALARAGLRDRVKVMIGGGIMNANVQAYTGADAYGNDPTEAVKLCQQFIEEN